MNRKEKKQSWDGNWINTTGLVKTGGEIGMDIRGAWTSLKLVNYTTKKKGE